MLRSLIERRALVSAYFNRGRSFLLTSVLSVETDAGELVLDCGREEEICRQALLAEQLILTAMVDKVKIQFTLRKVTATRFASRPAFRAALPDKVLRLQRREYFRLSTPIAKPVKFVTAIKRPDGSTLVVEASLIDISGGGVGLMATPTQMCIRDRCLLARCRSCGSAIRLNSPPTSAR